MNSTEFAGIPFRVYDALDISSIVKKREGETRFGEKVSSLPWDASDPLKLLKEQSARYVLIGLPEDIGVRANHGRGGSYSAWQPVLNTLLNVQSNSFLNGRELLVLGHFDFTGLMQEVKNFDFSKPEYLKQARDIVLRIDDAVSMLIRQVCAAGKEPIIIGGGHNNAYGCIKGAALGLTDAGRMNYSTINCMNCDAHADLRPMEGRHSGNGFSYAAHEGYLKRYSITGLHEIFNMQMVTDRIAEDENLQATYFEDIFIREKLNFTDAVYSAIDFTKGLPCGLELDMDIIQNIPSSAKTSSGISTIEARRYVTLAAANADIAYFHIAEAAPVLSHIKTDLKTGKLIAYLITDYLKARNERLRKS